jgi:hypothetical protein
LQYALPRRPYQAFYLQLTASNSFNDNNSSDRLCSRNENGQRSPHHPSSAGYLLKEHFSGSVSSVNIFLMVRWSSHSYLPEGEQRTLSLILCMMHCWLGNAVVPGGGKFIPIFPIELVDKYTVEILISKYEVIFFRGMRNFSACKISGIMVKARKAGINAPALQPFCLIG